MECLRCISSQFYLRVLVFVDVVDNYFVVICGDVPNYEILFEGGWQHRISAIVDVLSDDVYSPRGAAVKSWTDPVEIPEASTYVFIPWLVFFGDGAINVLVDVSQLLNDRYGFDYNGVFDHIAKDI